jgi:two-component system, OmpR family, sensor histidine kinase PrrB
MSALASLRGRVTALVLLTVTVAIGVSGALIVAGAYRDARRQVDGDLEARAGKVLGPRSLAAGAAPGRSRADIMKAKLGHVPLPLANRLAAQATASAPAAFAAKSAAQRLLSGSGTFSRLYLGARAVKQAGDAAAAGVPAPDGIGLDTVTAGGHTWRTLTVDTPAGTLEVGERLDTALAGASRTRGLVIVLAAAVIALTGAMVWLLAGVALAPLRRLQASAARVSSTRDLRTRLPHAEGVQEVAAVAGSLNAMLARLESSAAETERALAATRRFAADAGHELRTPLTGIQAGVDVLRRNPDIPASERDRILVEVSAEQRRLVGLLEALQALARGDAATSGLFEEVDLAELLEEVTAAARRRHPLLDLRVTECPVSVVRRAWADGMRMLVDNLVENAAVHAGERARVALALRGAGEELRLSVEDDGPGIREVERTRVFERFARGSTDAPGSGLGLAIVAQQAAVHGGAVEIGDSPLGGARVVVTVRVQRVDQPAAAERAAPTVS